MKFTKMQGAGNDFILVETNDVQRDWSLIAVAICNRHFGIGGDGLLLILPSDKAAFRMQVFNPDGSEAEACGNGLRCLVRYAVDRGLTSSGAQEISVETISGLRRARLQKTANKVTAIQVSMGTPRIGPEGISVESKQSGEDTVDIKSKLRYTATIDGDRLPLNLVSMGNLHAIHFSQQPVSDFPLSRLGPKVEHLAALSKNVNFEVAKVMNSKQIEVRVWERGVGETLACGSGACAVAVAARLHEYIGNKVDIKLYGGVLEVEWDGVGEVFLSAPVEIVFHGEWLEEV